MFAHSVPAQDTPHHVDLTMDWKLNMMLGSVILYKQGSGKCKLGYKSYHIDDVPHLVDGRVGIDLADVGPVVVLLD